MQVNDSTAPAAGAVDTGPGTRLKARAAPFEESRGQDDQSFRTTLQYPGFPADS